MAGELIKEMNPGIIQNVIKPFLHKGLIYQIILVFLQNKFVNEGL